MLGTFHAALDYASLGLSPTLREFHVFGFDFALRWYSLAYIAGILGGWWYLGRLIDAGNAPLTRLQADDFITWVTLGIILGGRLGYVCIYDPAKFAADPAAIVRVWEGGMSFHGGAAGAILAIILFARAKGLQALRIVDYVACVAPIGQLFGRLANFVNGELWGRETGTNWGVIFPGAGKLPRHPSQLYEAAGEGVLLLIVLSILFWRTPARRYPGMLAGAAIAGFGAVRFGIEFFRQPDAQVGFLALGLTMGQWLCAPMVLIGLYLMLTSRARADRLGLLQAA